MIFFIKKDPNLKKKKKIFFFFFFFGGGGGRWTDTQTGPNQYAPSTSLKLGA